MNRVFLKEGEAIPQLTCHKISKDPMWVAHDNRMYKLLGATEEKIGHCHLEWWCQVAMLVVTVFKAVFCCAGWQAVQEDYKNLGSKNLCSIYQESTYPDLTRSYKPTELTALRSVAAIARHEDPLIKKDFFAPVYFSYDALSIGLGVAGLAYLAARLKKKNQLEGLHVCRTLSSLKNELVKIQQSGKEGRFAFVCPVHFYIRGAPANFIPKTQHKVTICVEQVNGHMKIAILNSQPCKIKPEIANQTVRDLCLPQQDIHCDDLLFWTIFRSSLDFRRVSLYHSDRARETRDGCCIFALRDAVSFLRSRDFFSVACQGKKECDIPGIGAVYLLSRLPPEFMVGTQSIKKIQAYLEEHPAMAQLPFYHKKGFWNLRQSLEAHTLENHTKKQNYYIGLRAYKYYDLALKGLEEKDSKTVLEEIGTTLCEEASDEDEFISFDKCWNQYGNIAF